MGYVRVRAKAWNVEEPSRYRGVELPADTGAVYMALPTNLLKELDLKPIGKRRFRLTNNQVTERDIGIVGIEVQGVKAHTVVVFGDENVYLLGVVTLEELGPEVDPVNGELRPTELLLM